MRINTFFYSVGQGIKNIFQNKMFSLASIATMAACIFMFGLFYIIISNFNGMVKEVEEGVAVTVFFDEGITEEQIEEIGKNISKRAEVREYKYVSADEAWAYYKEEYFEGSEQLAEGFNNDNPLMNSANFEIYLNDVSMQKSLVLYLESVDGIRSVKQSEAVANTLADFNKLLSYISVGIIIILLCVAVFLISNTITTGITVRKEEIGIMKLIGATDYLVRAPFVVEGVIIGLVGAAIPLVLLYVLYEKIIVYVAEQFNFIGSMLEFIPADTIFRTLLPIGFILGVGIGFIGSKWTVRKHLKV
ncbi:MAG: permease-like cell division protein FtsX [Agathobacter sp.]|nr:permease-like cell division protein FtsX [Agathobacter sp.]